jgi:ADP-ribose pyrophosphatase
MIRQFRLSAGKVLWEIPAGTIEEGEKPEDCAVRELKEETGYTAESMKLLFRCYPTPGYSTEVMHCFLATSLTRHRRELDEDEVISVKPTALEAVFRMIASGEIIDAKTIAVVSYLRAR